ncbi:hypothetical protein [Ochrovirga pacifica]|uniref:hypothetical protein n=1 Tax=Ochrovirga pacifica TaxID=1042376 RepID=UPI0002DC4F5C|nr:hypothetical protein [Ochrovirga pacifica]
MNRLQNIKTPFFLRLHTHRIYLFFVLVLMCFLQSSNTVSNPSEKVHKVAVVHPAIDKKNPIVCYLVERQKANGNKEFYLDVDSVNCGENVCKVVTVRMFWDEIGRYTHYELQDGEGLEKKEGAPFTSEDYKKLEWVLQNKNSELAHVFKDNLVTTDFIEHGAVDVDAVSGATSTVSPSETVEGAVWTCYTLWHWANGEIESQIKNITRKQFSEDDLIAEFLKNKDSDYKKFAIESFLFLGLKDTATVTEVVQQAVFSEYAVFKRAMDYIETIPAKHYYASVTYLFAKGDYKKRVACLNSVAKTNKGENTAYYNQLSKQIATFSYQEVEMFLSNLKQHQFSSDLLIEQLVNLLEADNFLIARRAYWFLLDEEENLHAKQKKKLKKFKKQYKDRL